ncbi:MAG: VOC family protein [Bacteroidota bacterium]|nr:VOC family protein [Bacteroidota bacterium]
MQKISPFLWFDNNAEEAVNFYISVFKNSKIVTTTKYSEGGPLPAGTVMVIVFQIDGQEFMALNGGPVFKFSQAISFVVKCETQEEIDALWEKLSDGGEIQQCGWLKDKFGVSWQIVPTILGRLMSTTEPDKLKRVTDAIDKMIKIDIDVLQQAYDNIV